MAEFENVHQFVPRSGDAAHLAAAAREPAHFAALSRRIEAERETTRARLSAALEPEKPRPAVVRPLRLVPRQRSGEDDLT